MVHIRFFLLAVVAMMMLVSCEGDHEVIETDWTTLETVELNDNYRKYMKGDWVYQHEDSIHYIEMMYSFNTTDSTLNGYYNELMNTSRDPVADPDWQLLWQGEFSGRWALLHSVELKHDYIYMEDMDFKNVHGVLAQYDVFQGRVLFYGASRTTLRVTTPLTFQLIDMHHPQ